MCEECDGLGEFECPDCDCHPYDIDDSEVLRAGSNCGSYIPELKGLLSCNKINFMVI